MQNSISRLVLFWTGLALAGNVLAATAKFQIKDLPLHWALQVGHIQFKWTAYAELACILLVLTVWLIALKSKSLKIQSPSNLLILLGIALFAIQHLVLMPPLHERTLRVIAGEVLDKSNLHKFYAIAETIKFFALVVAGWLPNYRGNP